MTGQLLYKAPTGGRRDPVKPPFLIIPAGARPFT